PLPGVPVGGRPPWTVLLRLAIRSLVSNAYMIGGCVKKVHASSRFSHSPYRNSDIQSTLSNTFTSAVSTESIRDTAGGLFASVDSSGFHDRGGRRSPGRAQRTKGG